MPNVHVTALGIPSMSIFHVDVNISVCGHNCYAMCPSTHPFRVTPTAGLSVIMAGFCRFLPTSVEGKHTRGGCCWVLPEDIRNPTEHVQTTETSFTTCYRSAWCVPQYYHVFLASPVHMSTVINEVVWCVNCLSVYACTSPDGSVCFRLLPGGCNWAQLFCTAHLRTGRERRQCC